jgi:DNA primase
MEHIDFPSSVRKIAEMFGIDISDMTITMRTNKVLQDTKRFVESMRRMLDIREIEPYDISVLGELHQINSYRHFDKETLNYFGVKYCTYAEIQREDKRPLIINKRIVVPIYNNGTIVGVTMRRTDNNPIKWIHQPDGLITGNTLYNIDNIKQSDTESIIVCEGVWDVMNYYQNGYPNAVATFGCHLTEQQERILLQNTYNVILSYDMDEAGISGAIKVISRLKNKVNIRIANIPNGKDAGELNVDEINHTLAHSLSILEFNERVGLSAKQGNSNIRRRI